MIFDKWRRKRAEKQLMQRMPRAQVFDWIHTTNRWGSGESASGRGSELARTAAIRSWFPQLLKDHQVMSLLDLPCGDLNWLQGLELPTRYIGADIVETLIAQNRMQFPQREFLVLDVCQESLPSVDMVLMRDLLVHLSFADIQLAMDNLQQSDIRWLACTTYPTHATNQDQITGKHRHLNMQKPPFFWPEPSSLYDEEEKYGKALGIWRVKDLAA